MSQIMQNSLVVAMLFFIIAVPLYFVSRRARLQKKKKINDRLKKAAAETNLSFQFTDHLDTFSLALDQTKNVLVQFEHGEEKLEVIDLKDIHYCQLIEKKQGNQTNLLQLLLSNQHQVVKHNFTFYRQFQDNEMRLRITALTAAVWETRLNECIKQIAR
jgi:hypothetical protein